MISTRFAFGSLFIVALATANAACSAQDAAGGNDDSSEGALANQGGAAVTPALGIDFVAIHPDPIKATQPDPDFPDMSSCETDISYVQINGTKFDAPINAFLKGDAKTPTTCEVPESVESTASISYLGKGFMSVSESGSWYSVGAAHPSFGIGYKNVDLTTGKPLKLTDLLVPAAKDTILRSLRVQIGNSKVSYKDASGKLVVEKVDADSKTSLLYAAKSAFGDRDLAAFDSFSLSSSGLRIDLVNELPHAMQAAPSSYVISWATLDKAGRIVPAMRDRLLKK